MHRAAKKNDNGNDYGSLSDRERQVMQLVCRGFTNKAIADRLGVAEGTVKLHVHHIYKKLGVRSRWELQVQMNKDSQ